MLNKEIEELKLESEEITDEKWKLNFHLNVEFKSSNIA